MPLPSDETTPPVTKTYLTARASRLPPERVELAEHRRALDQLAERTRSPRMLREARAPIAIHLPRPVSLPTDLKPSSAPRTFEPASPSIVISRTIAGKQDDGGHERRPAADRGEEIRLERAARLRVELVPEVRREARRAALQTACAWRAARPPGSSTSFSTPVVRRARRWARSPRSGPLQDRRRARRRRSRRRTARPRAPSVQPTSGRRRPPVIDALRPEREHERPRAGGRGGAKPARSRPVSRWPSGSSTSRTVEARAQRVDRHADLAAEAGRKREAPLPRALR